MKKKLAIIIPISILLVLIICVCVLMYGKGITVGRCIVIDSDTVLLVDENGSPISLGNMTSNKDIFNGLTTGDEILVVHDGINESYPAQTGVYLLIHKNDGTWNDIPNETIQSLQELGWLDENDKS